jgi:hypothetical protein
VGEIVGTMLPPSFSWPHGLGVVPWIPDSYFVFVLVSHAFGSQAYFMWIRA